MTNAFGISGIQNVSSYSYDNDGNQVTFTDPNNHTTTNIFDALNRQVQVQYPDGTKTSTGYDADGRSVVQTNQDGIVTWFGYDGTGRLIAVTNAASQVTRYQYDEAGNQTTQIDALNRINTYVYDGLGRKISHTMPGGQAEGFAYDLAGNQIYDTNFNGTIITNQYNAMNRLTNTASVNGYHVSFAYSPTGQRTNLIDASGTNNYSYDNQDRLLLRTMAWANGLIISLNYRYDANGEVSNIWSSISNGVNLIYNYDPLSRLTNVLANGILAASHNYDPAGNLQSLRYGNGVTNLYQYDAMNRLTNNVWQTNGNVIASFAYTLGLTGERTALTETNHGVNRNYVWKYDGLYRLTNEVVSGTAPVGTLGYNYDAVGNRTVRTNTAGSLGPANQAQTFNTNDWLQTDAYDNNGNTLWSTNGSVEGPYQYDAINRLTNYNNSVYLTYDGDGNRVKKTAGGVTTYYLVDDRNPSGYAQVLEEWTASGGATNLSRVYNYGLNLISQRVPGSSTNYFICDGHGSTRMLTDAGGNFVNAFTYDAYGILIASNSAPQTQYLYCGQQFDPDLGLYYNRARYLNEGTGRFWTMDTYTGDNEDPLSLHKYLYGADNPVNMSDPSGNDYGDFDINISSILSPLINSSSSMLSSAVTSESGLGAFAGVGINVDVYIWKWKGLGVSGPGQHSVGHVMVIDDGTQNVEVSQFPHGVGEPSTPRGPNHTLSYNDTYTEEQNRNPDSKFLVHLPNPTAFHAQVENETHTRKIWDWDPHGPNETQCARAGYDVLKAGGLPLWGYGGQGLIMPGWLSVKLNRFVNSQASGYSVSQIK